MMKWALSLAMVFCGLCLAAKAPAVEVKPMGRIFMNFNYNLSGYPDWDSRAGKNDFAEFDVSRAYLGLDAKFTEQWSAMIVGDVYRPTFTEVEAIYDEDSGELADVEVSEEKGPYT